MLKPIQMTIVLMLGLAQPAFSQPEPSDWPSLVQNDPNGYVLVIQEKLQSLGLYDGPLSGILTRATITSLSHFCVQKEITDVCVLGPMRAEAARALFAAFNGPAGPTQDVAIPLPRGWYADMRDGLALEIVGQTSAGGRNFWDVRVHGKPTKSGWSNLELLPRAHAANTDRYAVSLEGMVISSDPRTIATFDVAVKAPDFTYLGGAGLDRKIKKEMTKYTLDGDLLKFDPEVYVTPYVQFIYVGGDAVDITLRLSAAELLLTSP